MIYFDNGATTLQKPAQVGRAVADALYTCANPGRGGHKPAMKAAEIVFRCRESAAGLFGVDTPENIVFTHNATHGLNIAIKSLLYSGGHAVISGYEHNSVVRPLEAMKGRGVTYTVAHSPLFDAEAAFDAVKKAITDLTKCVIINHVSNVFGFILPVEKIDSLCAQMGIPLVIDASQSAGVLDIDVSRYKAAAFVCMPGHKALYGPQGTGILICRSQDELHSLIEGGTGSNSLELAQPDFLPDIFESGTPNVPGIAGLAEGINYVTARGITGILQHEQMLAFQLASALAGIDRIKTFYNAENQAGVLSMTVAGLDNEELAEMLAEKGVCTRPGLHCAPLAHISAGTLPAGTLRISFSAFNTSRETDAFIKIIAGLLKKN